MPITDDLKDRPVALVRRTRADELRDAPQQKPKKRVACYCRVSSRLDAQEDSIDAQKAHFVRRALADPEVTLVNVYYEDGISGREAGNRPEFQRMMRDCRAGRIDEIWVKSISRWARNIIQLLQSLRELKDLGVNTVFEQEHLETAGGNGELMLTLIGSFAEYEAQSIRMNTKMGYRVRMQAGQYHYKRPPFGYDATGDGRLVPNPVEAPVVKRIFRMCLDGVGSVRTANILQAEAVPTKHGAPWQPGTVRAILANITYTGDVILQKTIREGNGPRRKNRGEEDQYLVTFHHEPIIDRETYRAAQAALVSRARGRARGDGKSGNRYAFSGKLVCGHCGHHLHRIQGKVGIRWICTAHRARGCPMKPMADLEIKDRFAGVAMDIDRWLANASWPAEDGVSLRLQVNRSQRDALQALRDELPPGEYARHLETLEAEAEAMLSAARASADALAGSLRQACRRIPPGGKWSEVEPVFTGHVDSVTLWADGRMAFRFACGARIVSDREKGEGKWPFR